jgi:hypothetical protein
MPLRPADNPFAVHRVLLERYRLSERDWTRLLDRLTALRHRAAIVGPSGSGKTTLLEDLAGRLSLAGHRTRLVRWDSSNRKLPELSAFNGPVMLLCDGAEQLRWLDWCRLRLYSARLGGLVITSHREGMLPTLHRCETSAAVLEDLCASLGLRLTGSRCRALHERHRGNLRDALRELYDECAVNP